MTKEFFSNLVCTLYSRGELLSKATGGNFSASEELVRMAQDTESMVSIEEILDNSDEGSLRGVRIVDGEVIFDGFPESDDEVEKSAQEMLKKFIIERCSKSGKVKAKRVNIENERFTFRIWLITLGIKGEEFKAQRQVFYQKPTQSP